VTGFVDLRVRHQSWQDDHARGRVMDVMDVMDVSAAARPVSLRAASGKVNRDHAPLP
jgi:hypothetical protein